MLDEEHPGTEEVAGRLEAYASARLAPRRGSTARMRRVLIEEARMRSLDARIGPRPGASRAGRRRLAALILAATLAIVAVAGVTAASGAGGPLYDARVWLETATLPTEANARAVERIHQIDARVLEVERAAASGDQNAVAAAIAAYRSAVQSALGDAGTDEDRLAHLKAALGLHVVVLETLAERVPAPAMDAIDRAIESSQKAVDRIDHTKPGKGPPGNNGPSGNGQPGNSP